MGQALLRCALTNFVYEQISNRSSCSALTRCCLDRRGVTSGPKPYRVLFTRTKPGFATRDERAIRETMASAGIPIMATDLAERAAYRSMFTYRQSLDELDPQAVNGLDKARENADALASEIVEILRTAREPVHV